MRDGAGVLAECFELEGPPGSISAESQVAVSLFSLLALIEGIIGPSNPSASVLDNTESAGCRNPIEIS